jgi:restriction endonuclease/NACHT domain-containing protein
MPDGREKKTGEAFERYVADAYRALGYQVTRDTQVAGRQTDLLAKQEVPGAPTIKLVIECKDHKRPVGIGIVNEFISSVVAQCAAGEISGGALVSKKGFTPQAREAAGQQKDVTLLSQEELSSKIVNVRYPLQALIEDYEKQEIFHDYLPLKVEALRWSSMIPTSVKEDFHPHLKRLLKFDGDSGTSAMVVLADFGAGKTTLLRNIEYHRAKAYLEDEDSRIPLFVQLRDFRDSQDVGTLLRASFRDAFYRDLPLALLWQRIESGGFYLLLDGFDEMVDRSDAGRRLELFHALVPLLRSRSPVILTSRPSYLVERGELEALLKQLRAEEASIVSPVSGGAHNKVVLEQLRQQLFAQMRESNQRRGTNQPLSATGVEVVRLQPLDTEQVKEFISRHREQLAEIGATVPDLLAFIDRTYDLSDLATRPMLLRLIVETAVIGGLDLSDTSTHYGASGLYEVYTRAKLDLDLDKVRGKDGALHRKARRQLAESIALEMYRAKSLELDFHDTWERLAAERGPLAQVLARTSLSQGEIATDLATRSFLTVDQDGLCRFIHKSFRGFFIARILKEKLPQLDAMFEEPLEREILYFLGGFDPTQPHIGEVLWSAYRQASMSSVALRRNLIVAFLYTRPSHDSRKIENTELFEAEFGRLQFNGTRMSDVTWRDVTAARLDLVKVDWKEVHLQDTHFGKVLAEGGEMSISMHGGVIESWDSVDMETSLTGVDSTIEAWELERATVKCTGEGFQVNQMHLKQADVSCDAYDHAEFSLLKTAAAESRLRLAGDIVPRHLEASDSLIAYGSERDIDGRWRLKGCVLLLSKGPAEQSTLTGLKNLGLRCDRGSVILAPSGISQSLLTSRAGVFGSLAPASGKRPVRFYPDVWGVLEAEAVLERIGLPSTEPGCRLGRLLLVRKVWYDSHVREPTRRRPVVAQLESLLVEPSFDPADPDAGKLVTGLRVAARNQHQSLLKNEWVDFEDYVTDEKEIPLA